MKYTPAQIDLANAFHEFATSDGGRKVLLWLNQQGYMDVCPFLASEHNPTLAAEIAGKQQLVAALNNEVLRSNQILSELAKSAGSEVPEAAPVPKLQKKTHHVRKQ